MHRGMHKQLRVGSDCSQGYGSHGVEVLGDQHMGPGVSWGHMSKIQLFDILISWNFFKVSVINFHFVLLSFLPVSVLHWIALVFL